MRLKELEREAWLCNHCSLCTQTVNDDSGFYRICPVYEQLRFEDSSARGHNTIAFYLLNGTLEYNQEIADCVYNCTTCAACEEICKPFGTMLAQMGGSPLKTLVDPVMSVFGASLEPVRSVELLEAMRADCVDLGLEPESVRQMAGNVEQSSNIYGEPHAERLKWAEGLNLPSTADTVLFVGCNPAYRRQEIAVSTAKILRGCGIEFAVLPDEWCCGSPLLRTGSVDTAQKMIRHNVDLLREMKVRNLVTACAEGYMAISRDWPKYVGELPFKVQHISELLARLMSERKLKLKRRINKKVTYHDPCHLGRVMGVYGEPRAVLGAIPGIELVEMYPARHAAWCCGAGGGLRDSNPEMAQAIGAAKVPFIRETGASVLASACPFCKTQFIEVIEKSGESIEVRDLTELVAESMGVQI